MILLRLLGYAWSLPLSLVGLLLAVLYRPQSIRWSEGALELVAGRKPARTKPGTMRTRIWARPGAQTWGAVIWYAGEAERADVELRRHERVHVLQAMVGGVLYGLAYVGHWGWLMVRTPSEPAGWPRWRRAYWWCWAERMARGAAGI